MIHTLPRSMRLLLLRGPTKTTDRSGRVGSIPPNPILLFDSSRPAVAPHANCNATTTIFPIPIRAHHRSRPGAPPFFVHALLPRQTQLDTADTPGKVRNNPVYQKMATRTKISRFCSPLERSDPIPGRELSNCGAGVGASPTVLAVVVAWHHPVPSIDLAGGRADESTYETTEPRYGM